MQPDMFAPRLTRQISKEPHLAHSFSAITPNSVPRDTPLLDLNNKESYKKKHLCNTFQHVKHIYYEHYLI